MGRWAKEGLADLMRQGFMKPRASRKAKAPPRMTRAQEIRAREARYEESVRAMGIREINADDILRVPGTRRS